MNTETWKAPANTICCNIPCDKPATREWIGTFVTDGGEEYQAETQGCDEKEHGPDYTAK